ncbi:MAG: insulinase family protein, partial [Bacteroidota bacterium]
DWAHQVTFEGEEIDKERGVIISEWRTRLGAQDRALKETLPKLLYGSRYVDRLPIGDTAILAHFAHDTIRAFYNEWYRPDLMAVVAVGDFDLDEVEGMIKTQFGRIPAHPEPTPRPKYKVPNHDETLIAIVGDPEANFNRVDVTYKRPARPEGTMIGYREELIEGMASQMINDRLAELQQLPEPPFTAAFSGAASIVRGKSAFRSVAIVPPGQYISGLEAVLTENQRAIQHGFTQSELDRTKKAYLAALEKQYRERDKTESRALAGALVQNFLTKAPVPGIEAELELTKKLLPTISLTEINAAFKKFIRDDNRVITASGNDQTPLPTEAELRGVLNKVKDLDLTPYEDKVSDAPLMADLPEPGRVTGTKTHEEVGITEFNLSNGALVVLKPTDFKNDEIRFTAFSSGGTSLYSDADYMSASRAASIINLSGVGEFDNIELDKYLADKVVQVGPYINEREEGMQGACSPKDLETFLQLVNLYFTAPRKDEKAFASFMARSQAMMANVFKNPEFWFRNEVNKILTNDHPRRELVPPMEKMAEIDLERAHQIYQERFANAGEFTFLFVGNFEVEKIKPMLEQYLASLPLKPRRENWENVGVKPAEGPMQKTFYRGQEPKSQVSLRISAPFEWDLEERFAMSSAASVLRIMMRESMREEQGGVYGVGVGSSTSRFPTSRYSFNVGFTCAPDAVDMLISTAKAEMVALRKDGVSEQNLTKVKETLRKDLQVNMKRNGYWMGILDFYLHQDLPYTRVLDGEKRIDELTAEDINAAADKYFDPALLMEFVLKPKPEGD